MLEYNDLPEEVASVVLTFTHFIRNDDNDKLSYNELVSKFNESDTYDGNTCEITNEEEDFFDFDFGCLGGTFTNIDGEAHLDCLQWYDDSEDDEPEVIDINTNNI